MIAASAGREALRPRLRDLVVAAALFVVAFTSYASTSTQFLELRDEGHILELSRAMLDGDMPHRDTSDIYGPGVYAATAAALEVGGNRILAVHRLLAATRAGAVALAYLLACYTVPFPFALLTAIVSLAYWGRMSWNMNVPYASVYTIPIALLACVALLESMRRDNRGGYFATGLVAGAAILFKQSLGIMNVVVMGAALWAASTLGDTRRDAAPPLRWLTTAGVALLLAIASVLPFLKYLTATDYLLHFAPMHAVFTLVAISALRRGETPNFARLLTKSGLPFGAGVVVLPALVSALYVHWGAFDTLFHDLFVLPTRFENYYSAIVPPPRGFTFTVIGVVAACSSGMLLIAGRRAMAALASGISAVAMLAAWLKFGPAGFATWDAGFWTKALDAFGGTHLFVLSAAAAVLAAPAILRRQETYAEKPVATIALVTLILLQQSFSFTIFPSAGYNVFLIQGAVAPLLGYVLWNWYRATDGNAPSPLRQAMRFALVLVLPLWMVGSIFATTTSALLGASNRTPIGLDVTEGIELNPAMRQAFHIEEFVKLVEYLRQNTTPQTRLLPLTNEQMILFASGRRHAFPDLEFYLFISGWGLMHGEEAAPAGSVPIVERLDHASGDIVVIDRADPSSANVRRYFPGLVSYIDSRFEVVQSIGGYRVLRRKTAATD